MDCPQALDVHRVYGFSSSVIGSVVDIRTNDRDCVAYAAGNIIVIYHCPSRRQMILQGHIHQIKCLAATPDKSCLISADCGPDAAIIIWDCSAGQVIKAIAQDMTGGIIAMDISPDGAYFATLTDTEVALKQAICIWDIAITNDKPLSICIMPFKKPQTCIRFNGGDQTELITNGKGAVYFWKHIIEEKGGSRVKQGELQSIKATLKASELKQVVGAFTVSAFVPNTRIAITATIDGDVVVWEEGFSLDDNASAGGKSARSMRATKVIKLHNTAIIVMRTIRQYVATGGADGYLHFYDSRLGLAGWFEELAAGDVTSLSFSVIEESDSEVAYNSLKVPPFVVGTKKAHILLLHAGIFEEQPGSDVCKGEEVTQYMPETVQSMAAHPQLPCFATISADGLFQIHDYKSKVLIHERKFSYLRASLIKYSPNGSLIACGFTNGILKLVNSETLLDIQSFSFASSALHKFAFSHDGSLLAAADGSCAIALLSCRHQDDGRWLYIGKYRSHARPIVGVHFILDKRGLSRLFSVGQDNMLVEYDLVQSDTDVGLNLRGTWELGSLMKPSSLLPTLNPKTGQVYTIVADEGFKLRLYEAENYVCEKTFLGPSFGNPVSQMLGLRDDEGKKVQTLSAAKPITDYLAYVTREQMLGIMTFPTTEQGNLHIMGVVAHAGPITSAAISHDSKYLMTAGADSIVIVWRISMTLLDAALEDEWNQAGPYPMLPPGREGKLILRNLREQFFTSQIRAQGEDFLDERHLNNATPLEQLPDLLRAVQVFPSNGYIRDILHEIALPYERAKLPAPKSITFDDFVTLYANHKSMVEYNSALFQIACNTLGADPSTGKLSRDALLNMLQTEGEAMTKEELQKCIDICMGTPTSFKSLPKEVNGTWFAHSLLNL